MKQKTILLKLVIPALAVLLSVAAAIFWLPSPGPNYADSIHRQKVTRVVDMIVAQNSDGSGIINSQLQAAEIPAFLNGSYYFLLSELHMIEWRKSFLKIAPDIWALQDDLRTVLIEKYCKLEREMDSGYRCQHMIRLMKSEKSKSRQMLENYVHHLKLDQAKVLFETFFKDEKTGCFKVSDLDDDARDQLVASHFYQLAGDFEMSKKCLDLYLANYNEPWRLGLYRKETAKINLLQGKPPSPKDLQSEGERFDSYFDMVCQLLDAQALAAKRDEKGLKASVSKTMEFLKGKGFTTIENSLTYLVDHVNTPKDQLPAPTNYHTWVSYSILLNNPAEK